GCLAGGCLAGGCFCGTTAPGRCCGTTCPGRRGWAGWGAPVLGSLAVIAGIPGVPVAPGRLNRGDGAALPGLEAFGTFCPPGGTGAAPWDAGGRAGGTLREATRGPTGAPARGATSVCCRCCTTACLTAWASCLTCVRAAASTGTVLIPWAAAIFVA